MISALTALTARSHLRDPKGALPPAGPSGIDPHLSRTTTRFGHLAAWALGLLGHLRLPQLLVALPGAGLVGLHIHKRRHVGRCSDLARAAVIDPMGDGHDLHPPEARRGPGGGGGPLAEGLSDAIDQLHL